MLLLLLTSLLFTILLCSPIQDTISLSFNGISIDCQQELLNSENFQQLFRQIRFSKNVVNNIITNMPKYKEVEKNVTELTSLGMIKVPDWLPIVPWNSHITITQVKHGVQLARQYFRKIEIILNQTISMENIPQTYQDRFRLIELENKKTLNIIGYIICNDHDDDEQMLGDEPVLARVTSEQALKYLTYFIMDNYKNTANYFDKLLKFLGDDHVAVIEDKCATRFFGDDNIREFYDKLSIKMSLVKQLAKNFSMLMGANNDLLTNGVDVFQLDLWLSLSPESRVNLRKILEASNEYLQKSQLILIQIYSDNKLASFLKIELGAIISAVTDVLGSIEDVMCRESGSRPLVSTDQQPTLPDSLNANQFFSLVSYLMDNFENRISGLDKLLNIFLYESFNLFDFAFKR